MQKTKMLESSYANHQPYTAEELAARRSESVGFMSRLGEMSVSKKIALVGVTAVAAAAGVKAGERLNNVLNPVMVKHTQVVERPSVHGGYETVTVTTETPEIP